MVPLGLWLAIIGYGIAYAGVIKLGGGTCSLGDAFRGKCVPKGGAGTGGAATGRTRRSQQLDAHHRQAALIPHRALT